MRREKREEGRGKRAVRREKREERRESEEREGGREGERAGGSKKGRDGGREGGFLFADDPSNPLPKTSTAGRLRLRCSEISRGTAWLPERQAGSLGFETILGVVGVPIRVLMHGSLILPA